ncbi:RecA-family ATPase [Thioalkalivibrio sp. ALE21]|uniref:AAA family ATPase n=1 Tax=Thioalkalivibrio sp. ALE21 TaxID=1158175 RepID=UPI000D814E61|nr:AAA family ATPase [Thioalkalivibrio sp. ALE21]PYG00748.1 RecA-family ATPase [Thioalkalivibrio sp. ALE21]
MTATARKTFNTLATWDADELRQKLAPFRSPGPVTTASSAVDEPQLIDEDDLPSVPESAPEWLHDLLDPEGSGGDAFDRKYGDRSRAVQAAAVDLLRCGWSQDQVLTALWRSGPVVSVALDHRGQNDTKALAYLKGTVTKALAFAAAHRRNPQDVFSARPDVEGSTQGGSIVVPGWPETQVSKAEAEAARLTPTEIVEGLLFADLAALIAPGGVGKTTAVLSAGIGLALGTYAFGREVVTSGRVLYVTGEDAREQLAARRERIMDSLFLPEGEKQRVRENFGVWDVSEGGVKLTRDLHGNIEPTPVARQIVEAYKDDPPVLVIFDPVVSFGTSEGRPNDNEQGIIAAARQIIRGLGCCVLLIHHTGKANARDKTTDQYSGRGGSALADGSRMVFVLTRWDGTGAAGSARPPEALGSLEDSEVLQLHPAKTSYAPRGKARTIWIKRTGFAFQFAEEETKSAEQVHAEQDRTVLNELHQRMGRGEWPTKRALEDSAAGMGMARQQVRLALERLKGRGRIEDRTLPKEERRGMRQTYLCPVDGLDDGGESLMAQDMPSGADGGPDPCTVGGDGGDDDGLF